jgi:hypothetical protein
MDEHVIQILKLLVHNVGDWVDSERRKSANAVVSVNNAQAKYNLTRDCYIFPAAVSTS